MLGRRHRPPGPGGRRAGRQLNQPAARWCGRVGLYAGFCPRAPLRRRRVGGHPSRAAVADASCGLPGSSGGQPSNAPCLTLLRVGFTEPLRSPGALVVSYTTVSPLPPVRTAEAVCSLWHCPAGHPGWVLPTTLPCGARTFLGSGRSRSTRPPGRLVRALIVPARRCPADQNVSASHRRRCRLTRSRRCRDLQPACLR